MKKLLSLLPIILLFGSLAWGDGVPTYFYLGPQSMGTVTVGSTTASGWMAACDFPIFSCSPSYLFGVGTAEGTVTSWTASGVTYQSGTFGPGGTIGISVNGTSFLSGYLLSATAESWTYGYGYGTEQYERELSGTFRALVLNPEYWGDTDPQTVGGSFSIVSGFPHSPFAVGNGHLAVTSVTPSPEPGSLLLLLGGFSLAGSGAWRKLRTFLS